MTATVHGNYQLPSGRPAAGWILLAANTEQGHVRDPAGHIVFSSPVKIRLIDGEATFTVPPTDDETLSPYGFTYTVIEALEHVDEDDYRVVSFTAEDGTTVELAELVSDAEALANPTYVNGSLAGLLALAAELDAEVARATAAEAARPTTGAMNAAVQAAVDALVAGAPGALDTLNELAEALADDDDALAVLTSALAGKQDVATLPAAIDLRIPPQASVGAVMASDGFKKSDVDLNLEISDTGQQYSMNRPGADGVHMLSDHAYLPDIVPGHGDVLRSWMTAPWQAAIADFFFTEGVTGAQNVVLGSFGATFINESGTLVTSGGFSQGSVQFDISPRVHSAETSEGVFHDLHWRLFNVKNVLPDLPSPPDPYTSIMWGTFDQDLPEDWVVERGDDGKLHIVTRGTPLRMAIRYDEPHRRITVTLPDGNIRTTGASGDPVQDAYENEAMEIAAKYWGRGFAPQVRRPTRIVPGDPDDLGSDGYAGFLRYSVHGVDVASEQPVAAAIPRFGTGQAAMRFPAPRWELEDLIVVANVTLDEWDSSSADQQTFIGQWGRGGQHSYDWNGGDTNDRLRLLVSRDGTNNDAAAVSTVGTGFAAGATAWVASYRTAVDGATRHYTSIQSPDIDLGDVVWVPLGDPVAGTPGAPFTSDALVETGLRGRVNPLYGNTRFWGCYSASGGTSGTSIATALAGATIGQEVDYRTTYSGLSVTGDRGVPDGLSFVGTQASIDGLPGRLSAIEAALAATQPLDSDLTAIAALTTTTYGRAFLAMANQAALMALIAASSATAQGIVELATTAETTTGTDTARAVTPAGVQAVRDLLQPLDSDLTAVAALTPTNDDLLQRKAGAWVNRTISQVKSDMNVVADVINDGTVAVAPSQNAVFDALATRDTAIAAAVPGAWLVDIDIIPGVHRTSGGSGAFDTLQAAAGGLFYATFRIAGSPATTTAGVWMESDITLHAGTYDMTVIYRSAPAYGILTFKIDGGAVGTTQDAYSAGATNNLFHTDTGIVVATSGKKTLRIEVTGKNASSTSYQAGIQHIQFRRTA